MTSPASVAFPGCRYTAVVVNMYTGETPEGPKSPRLAFQKLCCAAVTARTAGGALLLDKDIDPDCESIEAASGPSAPPEKVIGRGTSSLSTHFRIGTVSLLLLFDAAKTGEWSVERPLRDWLLKDAEDPAD